MDRLDKIKSYLNIRIEECNSVVVDDRRCKNNYCMEYCNNYKECKERLSRKYMFILRDLETLEKEVCKKDEVQ